MQGKSYNLSKIKKGETKSCGHLKIMKRGSTKKNKIVLNDEYGIIFAGEKNFYFDLEDEKYLKNKYWYVDDYGYLTHCYVENGRNQYVRFHRLVMGALHNKDVYVDRKNRDVRDNRKHNLRICRHKDNDRNKNKTKRNTSGIVGVYWDKSRNKWASAITVDRKSIHLGRYDDINEATKSRLKAEIKYFKEFAPQTHLLNDYFSKDELENTNG